MLRPSSFADSLDTWAEKLSEELASQEPTCVFLSMWITIVALFCTFNPLLLQPNSWHLRIYDDLCGRMGTYVFPHLLQPRITCRFRVLEVEGLSTKPIYPVLGDSRIPQQLQPTLPRHQPFSDAYGSCFERGQRVKDDLMQRANFTSIWERHLMNYWHDGVLSFTYANYSHELDRHL